MIVRWEGKFAGWKRGRECSRRGEPAVAVLLLVPPRGRGRENDDVFVVVVTVVAVVGDGHGLRRGCDGIRPGFVGDFGDDGGENIVGDRSSGIFPPNLSILWWW